MNKLVKSMFAGFVATLVLSMLMVAKTMMGLMPALNPVAMLTMMAHQMMGLPPVAVTGWVIHFLIGTVAWGVLFALLAHSLPGGSFTTKGMVFGVLAWLLMMIMVMPLAGAGLFGLSLGIMAPVMTLMLHLVFGAVMGWVYDKLLGTGVDIPHGLAHS